MILTRFTTLVDFWGAGFRTKKLMTEGCVFEIAIKMSADISFVGSINERGFLNSLYRKGFTHEKCLLELVANTLDAQDKLASQMELRKKLTFNVQRNSIRMVDNGIGMDRLAAENMFAMHRENHSNDKSRGVSGIGSKPALCILSEKKPVHIYTRNPNGEYITITVPWDEIHSKGQYTGMVSIRLMNADEKKEFEKERDDTGIHGTTIKFPYNDELKNKIKANFGDVVEDCNPLDRIGVVFGRETLDCSYKHFEKPDEIIKLRSYNYFSGSDADFYGGKSTEIIEQYCSNDKPDNFRFIWKRGSETLEIVPRGSGLSTKPEISTTNLLGWRLVGRYEVQTGLFIDKTLFDPDQPSLPTTASAEDNIGNYHSAYLGNDCLEFLCSFKLVRNNQLIGLIPPPDIKITSARANPKSFYELALVQCEIKFYPVSSQDNSMDHAMNIQENKNQYNGSTVDKRITRLVAAIKKHKFNEIWAYFTHLTTKPSDENEDDEDEGEDEEDEIEDQDGENENQKDDVSDLPANNELSDDATTEVFSNNDVTSTWDEDNMYSSSDANGGDVINSSDESSTEDNQIHTPIDVRPHRRGVVFGREMIEQLNRVLQKINPDDEYSNEESIKLFNSLLGY